MDHQGVDRFGPHVLNRWQIPFYYHELTLIQAWISNHMPRKVLDEITYTFSTSGNVIPHLIMDAITYPYQG